MPAAARTPGGVPLEDGYQTIIEFAGSDTIKLFEKTVQPPGLEGGEKVDTTTMHNQDVRTYAPRWLKEVTDGQMTVAYDPAVLSEVLALINVVKEITLTHPDGSTWTFFGYLRSFVPGSNAEGAQPEATCTIVSTNVDPADSSETVPAYAAAV